MTPPINEHPSWLRVVQYPTATLERSLINRGSIANPFRSTQTFSLSVRYMRPDRRGGFIVSTTCTHGRDEVQFVPAWPRCPPTSTRSRREAIIIGTVISSILLPYIIRSRRAAPPLARSSVDGGQIPLRRVAARVLPRALERRRRSRRPTSKQKMSHLLWTASIWDGVHLVTLYLQWGSSDGPVPDRYWSPAPR
jgi:hypothetical protein